MSDIAITETGTKIDVTAPYHPEANADYRDLGGRFQRDTKTWRFDARDLDRVRDVLVKHFGRDDREPASTVTARITLPWKVSEPELRMFGRVIASRRGRDAAVRLGEDVVLISGKFSHRGGSMKYPEIGEADDVVLEVRDIPAGHADLDDEDVELVGDAAVDVDALLAERERLLARLAEIDAQLPEPEGTEVSTREAAAALGVSVRTVQRWAAAGKVEAVKSDTGRWVVTITL